MATIGITDHDGPRTYSELQRHDCWIKCVVSDLKLVRSGADISAQVNAPTRLNHSINSTETETPTSRRCVPVLHSCGLHGRTARAEVESISIRQIEEPKSLRTHIEQRRKATLSRT